MTLLEPPQFSSIDDAHAYLVQFCDSFCGVSNIAYLALNLPGRHANDPLIIATYRPDWVNHYLSHRYATLDPAIIEGMRGFLPFDWSARTQTNKRIDRFFGEASEFGVNHNGLSFPIRGPHGDKAMFSINSHLPDSEWHDFKHAHQGDLNLIGYWFHMRILQVAAGGLDDTIRLSPREREVLQWAAEGKTAWETGRILSISQKSVEFHLTNMMSKLRATSKPQAIAHAMRWGLLD